ncbi:MAG: sensor histidine kinase [Bacillota bacterium]
MRIGKRLLVTYLLLIGITALGTLLFLPRWVKLAVTVQEQERLQQQAEGVAQQLATRLRNLRAEERPRLGQRLEQQRAVVQTLQMIDTILTSEILAVTTQNGLVISTNRPELRGRTIPVEQLARFATRPARGGIQVEGLGSMLPAVAPIQLDRANVGLQVVMLYNISYVEELARGLTRWFTLMTLLILIITLVVVGGVSQEMVRRLRETGRAARALAEGDLTRRAPERGDDEIAELAGHFNHMAERLQALVEGLRRSEESRKALLAVASHEIRTPLTSIHGFAEALRDGVVPTEEKRQRYYQIIATESERLGRLVEDLFDVARLEAGQAELKLQRMAAGPWLAEFAESFHPAEGVRLELAVSPEAAASQIYGDRDRLKQVLTNLTANAVRFSPEGEAVRIEAVTEGEDLLVRVIDRGPGLSPEEAQRVFQRFYQGEHQGRGHKGAGLGLAIIKSLVEAHGGTVGVVSQPGQGATFWFRLKRLPAG